MAKAWNGSRPPRPAAVPVPPTTITESARRYHACAAALAKSFGLPLTEDFLQAYHAAIAAVYIEAGRAGVRLSGDVKLPPLTTPSVPLPAATVAPVEAPAPPATPVSPPVAAPQASSNGHTPAPAPPKGAPKALVQKSDLLREIQAELTRIGRPVGAVTTLYQAAFGTEVDTWDLVCGESLHTLKHGLAYLKTLTPEVSHGAQPGPTQAPASTIETAPAGEGVPVDPSAAASSSVAPHPDADAAERDRQRLRAEVSAWDLRVSEAEIKHIITHHPYSKARQLLWQARRHDTAAD